MERRGFATRTAVQRAALPIVATIVAAAVLLAACGDDSESGAATLPPIASTTTTTIPVTTTTEYVPIFHEIQAGDVLANIAAQYGVDYDELIALNGIVDPDHIELGDQLQIPPPTTTTTTSTTTTTTEPPATTTTAAP
jgi:LysM repeat protein